MNKLLFCIVTFLCLAACGKKGPLVPPEALAPSPVKDLTARQEGDRFVLCMTPPSRNDAGRPLKNLAGLRVMKREVLPPDVDCEECTGAYRLFMTVDMEYPVHVRRFGNLYCLDDTDLQRGKTYQYKAASYQADGTVSRDSNKVRLKFLAPPAAPVLRAVSSTTGVTLEWTAPPPPESGVLVGYNIYRSESSESMPVFPANAKPVSGLNYEDKSLEFGVNYFYTVRSVAEVEGELVESRASNKVSGKLKLDED
jgi:predicted small lipoprotein YifL